MKVETKLKSMFEYQKFAQNSRLSKLIEETEKRYANELSDDDLWMVNAAGAPEIPAAEQKKKPDYL